MITAFLSVIFWFVDPFLGLIVAVVSPAVIALDSDNSYGHLLAMVLFFAGVYFVKHITKDKDK